MSGKVGLNELKSEIEKQSRKEAENVLRDAENEASRITGEARAQAKTLVEREAEKARAEAAQKEVEVYSAKLEARRIMAEAHNAVFADLMDEIRNEFERVAKSRDYEKIFGRLVAEGKREVCVGGAESTASGDCRIHANKRDLPLAKKFGKTGEAVEISGGAIVTSADGRLRADNSFEAMLEEKSNDLKQAAFEEFFAKPTRAEPAHAEKAAKKKETKKTKK